MPCSRSTSAAGRTCTLVVLPWLTVWLLQGMNVIKAKSDAEEWNVDLAGLARIWKGGCIIRAGFLDRIKSAYQKDPKLDSLLLDEGFAKDLVRILPFF